MIRLEDRRSIALDIEQADTDGAYRYGTRPGVMLEYDVFAAQHAGALVLGRNVYKEAGSNEELPMMKALKELAAP